MSDPLLQQRVNKFVSKSINLLARYPSLRGLQRRFEQYQNQLQQPMRVAVVGKIKAGKSTAMNALLGEALVGMGTVEATFNINWLKYGETPALVVHFKDDRPPEPRSSEELAALTLRSEDPASLKFLQSIKYIEVFHPNPILQSLDLIDTPGLFSAYEVDSDNTSDFLKVHGNELNRITEVQVSSADAILYLFSHSSLSNSDRQVMEQFQGAATGRATPLNAIGVLTQADSYDAPEPLAAAAQITQRLMNEHSELRNLFYKIQPIAGLLALGAQTLDEDDFVILQQLAKLPMETQDKLRRNAKRFATKEYPDEPGIPPPSARDRVLKRLDLYGIKLACEFIAQGQPDRGEIDRATLSALLLAKSGVVELRDVITAHFGSRAYLIKFNRYLQLMKALLFEERAKQTDEEKKSIIEINKWLEKLEYDELFFQDLRELQVLGNLYDKQTQAALELSPAEKEELLQITGEKGATCAERLGLPADASLAQMQERVQSRLQYWRACSADPGNNPTRMRAATIIAQSCDRLAYYLHEAESHLNLSGYNVDLKLLSYALADCRDIAELASLSDLAQAFATTRLDLSAVAEFDRWLQQLKNVCFVAQQTYQGTSLDQLRKVAALVEKIKATDPALKELKLRQIYQQISDRNSLDLRPEEVDEINTILGKNGTTITDRLGLAAASPYPIMLEKITASKNNWLELANDPFGCDAQTRSLANMMVFTYDRLRYHLDEARSYLDLT